ncbi:hypothetical protein Zmor_026878 [Zophobas morio]|uniref:Phorbol-ester/DAG-type domain-containing protein n=1 Tax=Zophobas morio TaxID=2755281 RepID=A0AA38HUT8_9CUCU|nr:hypothetical protein Zmor_026878 [Zophobas morio]
MAPGLVHAVNTEACKRCKNVPKESFLKCVNCGSVFHKGCAKLLKSVSFVSDNTITCCDSITTLPTESESDQEFWDALSDPDNGDIRIVHYIIKQNDTIISQLNNQIKVLNEQVALLKEKQGICKFNTSEKVIAQSEEKVELEVIKSPVAVNKPELVEPVKATENLSTQKTRKTPSRKILVRGNAPVPIVQRGDITTNFAAVTKQVHLYVGNVNPNVTEEEVLNYLASKVLLKYSTSSFYQNGTRQSVEPLKSR